MNNSYNPKQNLFSSLDPASGLNPAQNLGDYSSMGGWGQVSPSLPLEFGNLPFNPGNPNFLGGGGSGWNAATPDFFSSGALSNLGGGAGPANWGQQLTSTLQDYGVLGKVDPNTGVMGASWGAPALGLLQAGLGAYMGMKTLDNAKQQLAFSKEAFGKNYNAQRLAYNSTVDDRNQSRNAANPGAYKQLERLA